MPLSELKTNPRVITDQHESQGLMQTNTRRIRKRYSKCKSNVLAYVVQPHECSLFTMIFLHFLDAAKARRGRKACLLRKVAASHPIAATNSLELRLVRKWPRHSVLPFGQHISVLIRHFDLRQVLLVDDLVFRNDAVFKEQEGSNRIHFVRC